MDDATDPGYPHLAAVISGVSLFLADVARQSLQASVITPLGVTHGSPGAGCAGEEAVIGANAIVATAAMPSPGECDLHIMTLLSGNGIFAVTERSVALCDEANMIPGNLR